MPHLVLGIWKARMFSAFGFGDKQNIAYGLLCFIISIGFSLKNKCANLEQESIFTY